MIFNVELPNAIALLEASEMVESMANKDFYVVSMGDSLWNNLILEQISLCGIARTAIMSETWLQQKETLVPLMNLKKLLVVSHANKSN